MTFGESFREPVSNKVIYDLSFEALYPRAGAGGRLWHTGM